MATNQSVAHLVPLIQSGNRNLPTTKNMYRKSYSSVNHSCATTASPCYLCKMNGSEISWAFIHDPERYQFQKTEEGLLKFETRTHYTQQRTFVLKLFQIIYLLKKYM